MSANVVFSTPYNPICIAMISPAVLNQHREPLPYLRINCTHVVPELGVAGKGCKRLQNRLRKVARLPEVPLSVSASLSRPLCTAYFFLVLLNQGCHAINCSYRVSIPGSFPILAATSMPLMPEPHRFTRFNFSVKIIRNNSAWTPCTGGGISIS